jgi:hypothetical protein
MPQPSLGRSVVDVCRPVLLVRDIRPLKLSMQAFDACHEIVKAKTAGADECSCFSRQPTNDARSYEHTAQALCRFFPN